MHEFIAICLAAGATISSEPRPFQALIDLLNTAIVPIFIGAVGGIVRLAAHHEKLHRKKWPDKIITIVCAIIVSAFAGWLSGLATEMLNSMGFNFSESTKHMFIGIGGFGGVWTVNKLIAKFEGYVDSFHNDYKSGDRPNKKGNWVE